MAAIDSRFAQQVLEHHYGVYADEVSQIDASSFNTVFTVVAGDERSVLRVGDLLRIHHDGAEAEEARWLAALHGSGFTVPTILPTVGADGGLPHR